MQLVHLNGAITYGQAILRYAFWPSTSVIYEPDVTLFGFRSYANHLIFVSHHTSIIQGVTAQRFQPKVPSPKFILQFMPNSVIVSP